MWCEFQAAIVLGYAPSDTLSSSASKLRYMWGFNAPKLFANVQTFQNLIQPPEEAVSLYASVVYIEILQENLYAACVITHPCDKSLIIKRANLSHPNI